MKKLLITLFVMSAVISLSAQQVFEITASGSFTFVPPAVTVNQGDIVRFNVGTSHPVLEVSQSTWDANGTTALNGGFSFPSGTGDYTAGTPGTHYYVCTAHVTIGMKGTITVNMATGINDTKVENETKVFPNPARDFIIYQADRNSIVREIRILDITSKSVIILHKPDISNDQVRIDIGNLNRGIYFIIVKSDDGIVSKKFIKS